MPVSVMAQSVPATLCGLKAQYLRRRLAQRLEDGEVLNAGLCHGPERVRLKHRSSWALASHSASKTASL